MMANDLIINVNESDFEYEVVAYSNNTPVVVDFWADWCRPCKPLTEILERLVKEAQGNFRLAMVNSDANSNLALRFGVRSLPTVKIFSGGDIVAEFTGAQPEGRVREFLAHIQPPSPAALLIEKGESLITAEAWSKAEEAFRQALEIDPNSPSGLLGLAKSMLAQGKGHEAQAILTSFPTSRQFSQAQALLPLADDLDQLRNLTPLTDLDERQAAYWNAVRLVTRGKITPALDGLMDLLRADKHDQAVRKFVLALFELLGEDNPVTREYRREFTAILF